MPGTPKQIEIDIAISAEAWKNPAINAARVARDAAIAAHQNSGPAEVSILLCDNAAIRILNRDYRGQNSATDTLSFPADICAGETKILGDIIVAYETAAVDAADQGKSLAHHLAHLVVHSYLHLTGFDHEEEVRAQEMEAREQDILASLGIADPYALP